MKLPAVERPPPPTWIRRPASITVVTVIWFSVIVPVLSAQITVVEPRVSTAASRRNQRPAAGEAPEAHGERQRQHRGQPLGYRGDREADRGLEHEPDRLAVQDARQTHHCADAQGQDDQSAAQPFHLTLERSGPDLGRGDQVTDAPQLGGGAGGGDEGEAATRQRRGAEVHHVGALGERNIWRRAGLGVLPHRGALAGERRFVDLQGRAPQQARVGRDRRAGLEQDHIARHQLRGDDPHEAAVAADRRMGNRERPQAGQ